MADDTAEAAPDEAPRNASGADRKAWVFGASATAVMWAFTVCERPLGGALTALTVYAWWWMVSRDDR
jgi:hypothetical protein